MLKQTADLSAILAVTIAHREEMTVLQAHDMRGCDVSILVCFVRVVSSNSSLGGKREFSDNVANFL